MEKFIKFLVIMIIGGGIVGFLELSGYLYHNDILAELAGYKVHGLDISHHQEKVNWTLVDKKYKFIGGGIGVYGSMRKIRLWKDNAPSPYEKEYDALWKPERRYSIQRL